MNKPDYISKPDWDILLTKYKESNLKKYLNKNYPYQYLIGNVEFYNSTIKVNKNVLIPRWETEELINRIVNKLKKANFIPKKGVDICTGSGCIAICLAKEYSITIDAIDVSKKALKVAKENVVDNNVSVNLIKKDVLKEEIIGKYDLIVCNPPYVKESETVGLETKYEPQKALFAKNNGLVFYEKLLDKIKNIVDDKYFIAMEIGSDQKSSINDIAQKYFLKKEISFEKDLNNRYRYLFITNIE